MLGCIGISAAICFGGGGLGKLLLQVGTMASLACAEPWGSALEALLSSRLTRNGCQPHFSWNCLSHLTPCRGQTYVHFTIGT